jgi:hypothetical protein
MRLALNNSKPHLQIPILLITYFKKHTSNLIPFAFFMIKDYPIKPPSNDRWHTHYHYPPYTVSVLHTANP